jgi:hypothetical protein
MLPPRERDRPFRESGKLRQFGKLSREPLVAASPPLATPSTELLHKLLSVTVTTFELVQGRLRKLLDFTGSLDELMDFKSSPCSNELFPTFACLQASPRVPERTAVSNEVKTAPPVAL